MIIGLSGYAGSGKDTVAKILSDNHDFKQIAFADKLREFLYAMNPIVGYNIAPVPLRTVIDLFGWQGYKKSEFAESIRNIIRKAGTEAGRGVLGEDVWVNAVFNSISQNDDYVISDCRFRNEADAVRSKNGFVVRITRDSVRQDISHSSETSLDGYLFDYIIENNGSIEELEEKVAVMLRYAYDVGFD